MTTLQCFSPPGSIGPESIKLPAVLCHEKKQLCLGMPLLCNEACSKIYLQQPLDEGLLTHQTRQKCFFVCSSLFCPSITSLVKADSPVSWAQMQTGRRSVDRCQSSPKTRSRNEKRSEDLVPRAGMSIYLKKNKKNTHPPRPQHPRGEKFRRDAQSHYTETSRKVKRSCHFALHFHFCPYQLVSVDNSDVQHSLF